MPLAVFVLVLGCGLYLVKQNHAIHVNDERMVVQQMLEAQESKLSRRLSYLLSSTYFLAQEVASAHGDFDRFDTYAATLLQRMDGINNLQLAPNGVITQIYPLAGNEKAIGHNILNDDKRKEEAAEAIQDRMLTIAGPFELLQGGIAVIGRNPVFLMQEDGKEKFWGFTSALILLEDLIGGSGLKALSSTDYPYELSRRIPETGKKSVFASHGDTTDVQFQSIDIKVPNGTWTLTIGSRENGDLALRRLGQIAALIVALLLTALTRRIADEPETLRQKVAKQTWELHQLAYFDGLTKLPNRHQFCQELATALQQNAKSGNGLALLLMDLDHFKEVNDTLGHDIGDILLCEASERMLKTLPENAMLARLGGDEFTVIIADTDNAADIKQITQDIIDTIAQPFDLQGNAVQVSASIGIASASRTTTSPGELLKCADLAMYEVKRRGRGGSVHYGESIQQEITYRSMLANDLRDAVQTNGLQLHYQPIMESDTVRVNKAEALLRWHHPTHGNISPAVFIPLAEETGLIQEIGDWVFAEAVRQSGEWRLSYNEHFQISVNVSPMQFMSDNQIPRWIAEVNAAGVDASSVLIEITEGVLLENDQNNIELLSSLKKAGMQIALDDFGTGYSSLAYLKMLDIDYLKIDRSFVQNLTADNKDLVLCQAILNIAKSFGYKVVAEGIETSEQEKLLCDIGCHYLQGFLYSKPIAAEDFEQMFLKPAGINTQLNRAS